MAQEDALLRAMHLQPDEFAVRWMRTTIRRPKTVFCASIMLPVVCLFLMVLGMSAGKDGINLRFTEEPTLQNRDDIEFIRNKAYGLAQDDAESSLFSDSQGGETIATQSVVGGGLVIIYQATKEGESVFTPARLRLIKRFEDLVTGASGFSKVCLFETNSTVCARPTSPTAYFFDDEGDLASDAEIDSTITDMASFQPPYEGVGGLVDQAFSSSNPESSLSRSIISYGLPLKGEVFAERGTDDSDDQIAKIDSFNSKLLDDLISLRDEAEKEGLGVYWIGGGITSDEFQTMIIGSLLLMVVAFAVVWVVLVFQTESAFLSTMSVVQIFMSFPTSIIIFRYVFFIEYIGILQILSLFLAVGIGADDNLLFIDTFKQSVILSHAESKQKQLESSPKTLLLAQMAWTFKHSASAMLLTSATTFAAFIATAISPYIAIEAFGVFAAIVVSVIYILVITFVPAVVVIWQTSSMSKSSCVRCIPRDELKPRKIDVLFGKGLGDAVVRGRWLLLATAVVLGGVCIGFATQSVVDDLPPSFLPDGTNFANAEDAQEDFGGNVEGSINLQSLVFGVAGLDEKGADPADPDEFGSVKYVSAFAAEAATEAGQRYISQTCARVLSLSALPEWRELYVDNADPSLHSCFIDDFWDWQQASYGNVARFSSLTGDAFVRNLTAFLLTSEGQPFARYVGIADGAFRYASISFATELQLSIKKGRPSQEGWKRLADKELSLPASLPGLACFPENSAWVFWNVQDALFGQVWLGLAVSLSIAFIVLLLFTLNPIVSILALISIVMVVVSILGALVMMDWKMGFVESILVTTSVGLAVDFTTHLGHAYVECTEPAREARVRFAINRVGLSVVSGAFTSICATILLIASFFVPFQRFGTIIAIVVAFSYFYAHAFFLPMLLLAGPVGGAYSLEPFALTVKRKLFGVSPEVAKAKPLAISDEKPDSDKTVEMAALTVRPKTPPSN